MFEFELSKKKRNDDLKTVDNLNCGNLPEPALVLGYRSEIDMAKLKVAQFDQKKWLVARDDTYPLSYLKGSGDAKKRKAIRTKKIQSVNSHLIPRSRSFFKMIEILDTYPQLLGSGSRILKVANLAEGPGGFMEAILLRIKQQGRKCKMFAITLKTAETNTDFVDFMDSEWIKDNQKVTVKLSYGADGTGDLYQVKNIMNFAKSTGACHLVTADGGFQETSLASQLSYTKEKLQLSKELWHYKLFLAEIITALSLQAKGGSFVLKLFDCYTMLTARLLYLLTCCYDRVLITKPCSSRPANSERYVVCLKFLGKPSILKDLKIVLEALHGMNEYFCDQVFDINLPDEFISQLRRANVVLQQQQIEAIEIATGYDRKKSRELRSRNRNNSRLFLKQHGLLN